MQPIQQAIDLTALNTLHLTAQASNYVILSELTQLPQIYQHLNHYPKFFILGGGSNIILPEVYTGLVIHNQLRGINWVDYDHEHVLVTAMAGENWDNFVASTLTMGGYGLENLSLIPGSVGAAPVQNIGAYGVEVKDFIHAVKLFDLAENNFIEFNNQECGFSYRNSIFKNNPRYLVVSVSFKLLKQPRLNTRYGDIAQQMAQQDNPSAADLRHCIIRTRQSKLPDPAQLGNAGSFFHNPMLATTVVANLKLTYPTLVSFAGANPQQLKVSAGWLIENLGLKGWRQGNLGIYSRQALVIVNHQSATKTEVLAFAQLIQEKVKAAYQIALAIEPIIL